MNPASPGPAEDRPRETPQLAQRLQSLEELYMHLQRTVQDLDQVIIEQGKRLAALEEQLRRAIDALGASASESASARLNLLDEKPPHY